MEYSFKEKQTPESMRKILITSQVANDRMAAISGYPQEDLSILPLLVQLVDSDGSIAVVNTAIERFNDLTKQSFRSPDYDGVNKWWSEHQKKFQ